VTGWKPDEIARRGLARTFQIPSPFEDLTVKENMLAVFTGGLRSGMRISEAKRARADELLELLEIDHVADQEAGGVSGGQEKLLELGRILMLEPACVMLDEPTAGVNPSLRNRLLEHLETLNDRGTTFVIIEHDMRVIADVCDRVTVFNQGQVLVEGDFESVTSDERVRDAYLGGAAEHDASLETLIGEEADAPVSEERGTPPTPRRNRRRPPAVAERCRPTARARRPGPRRPGVRRALRPRSPGSARVRRGAVARRRGPHQRLREPPGRRRNLDGESGRRDLHLRAERVGEVDALKTLAGVVPAWEGRVTHRGTDVTHNRPAENVHRGVTMLPQDGGIFGGLTVRENLLLGGYTVGEGRSARSDSTRCCRRSRSSGQTGRSGAVAVGRPTDDAQLRSRDDDRRGGVPPRRAVERAGPSLIDQVFEMTRRLVASGAQVILIEQNVREALRIADYVYILAQGQLQFEGPGRLDRRGRPRRTVPRTRLTPVSITRLDRPSCPLVPTARLARSSRPPVLPASLDPSFPSISTACHDP